MNSRVAQLDCPVEAMTVDRGAGCPATMIRAALLGQEETTSDAGAESSWCSAEE
jgi:hypothetical protein